MWSARVSGVVVAGRAIICQSRALWERHVGE
jgi:hypothetical protein